jgi:Heterokaryon incompatibility protein (HET)
MPRRKNRSVARFQHSRLQSPRSIRLVRLQPSSELSAPLDLNLLEVSLEHFSSQANSYEALSYVWGAPSGTVPCMCDGKELLITPNCNEALQHLRLPDDERVLWVDAICIDQGSSEGSVRERNVQITLMGEVYHTADRTLCWLGKGEAYTHGMFKWLRRIGSCPSQRELKKLLAYDGQCRPDIRPFWC